MDYYSTLGVAKNASQEDIKKAYKKQSMRHHPDRGGDEAQFKKVNEAYQTLGDPQKRAEYDNPQPQFNFNTGNMGGSPFGGGFEDIFAQAFGQGFRHPNQHQRHKNRDIQLSYNLDIKDAYTGRGTTITYTFPDGRHQVVDVHIPAGMKSGDVLRVPGYGDDTVPELPRGDLLLRVKLVVPRGWDINGIDLITSHRVDIFDLVLGTSVRLTTPEGRLIEVKVPKGSQPGTTLSVSGQGYADRTGRRGRLYVKLLASVPVINDAETLNKIKDIKERLAS